MNPDVHMDNSAIVMEIMAVVIMSEDKNAVGILHLLFSIFTSDSLYCTSTMTVQNINLEKSKCSRLECSISSYIEMQVH